MSDMNEEALRAQQEYEAESSGVQASMQPQPEQGPKKREGWSTTDGKFWKFQNYENLPAEYKEFLPRQSTKSKLHPDGIEPITHVDPQDGKTYKFWITFYSNGGSGVSSMEWNTSGGGGYSGGQKKSFYMDIGIGQHNINEANALLSANESDRQFKYKPLSGLTKNKTTKNPDGTTVFETEPVVLLVKQKRVEYGS